MKSLLSTIRPALATLLISLASVAWAGKADDTLNVAFSAEATTMDHYKEPVREGLNIGRLLYDCLLEKDLATGEFKPSLATSFKVVDDKTIDFEIRRNVKFHNGEPLTADDVAYTLNLVSSKEYGAKYQLLVDWIDRVEKTGDFSVRLHMKRPHPLALEMLAGNLPIYPRAYYEKAGSSGMSVKPIGTGPYRLVELTPGTRFVFERFDDYFPESPKGKPAIRRVVIRVIPEINTQYAELMNGGLDWIWRVPADGARRLAGRANLEIKSIETLRYYYISFSPNYEGGKSPLADVKVRQALNHAVNRPAIVKALVGGASQPIYSACSPLQFGCTTDVVHYPYDPAKAKQLLAEAGYASGFKTELVAVPGYTTKEQAEAIVADLGAVGVRATINFQQFGAAAPKWREGGIPLFAITWGSYGVADIGLGTSLFFAGTSDDVVKDPEVVTLMKKGDSTMDRDERKRSYASALQIIAEKAYWLPLWTANTLTAGSKDLDFTMGVDESTPFYRAKWR